MKQFLLLFTVVIMTVSSTSAQVAPSDTYPAVQTTASSPNPAFDGMFDGRTAANQKGTGGYFVGGLVGGVTLGLIGTGIAWGIASAGDPAPSQTQSMIIRQKGNEYAFAYSESYSQRVKQKRKRSAVTGGLIGTAAIVAVILSSY